MIDLNLPKGRRWLLSTDIDSIENRLRELELNVDRANILSAYYFDMDSRSMEHYEKISPILQVHSFSSAKFRSAKYEISDLGLWVPTSPYSDSNYDEFYNRMQLSPPRHVVSTIRLKTEHNGADYFFEVDLEMGTIILTVDSDGDATAEKLSKPFATMIDCELNELEYIARLLRLDQLESI